MDVEKFFFEKLILLFLKKHQEMLCKITGCQCYNCIFPSLANGSLPDDFYKYGKKLKEGKNAPLVFKQKKDQPSSRSFINIHLCIIFIEMICFRVASIV
jgi:hypothetical protein